MLQSTAVLTELGGGSLWQHIGEALKASFGQSRPHVREAHRPACGANCSTAERKSTVGLSFAVIIGAVSSACGRTFARVAEYRLNGQQCSSGATQQCAQQPPQ
jgi:hypothetical protein